MPLAIAPALAGIVYGIHRACSTPHRPAQGDRGTALRSPITYCIVGTLGLGRGRPHGAFLTNRYLGDMFPAVALCLIAAARGLAQPAVGLSGRAAAEFWLPLAPTASRVPAPGRAHWPSTEYELWRYTVP